ncbi:hypothetical protein METBIDRAFT_12735 [Metschnikowia bicuspidata var. bicuspidata NRRL YB-4993]|uniref:Uncharacterized protein n=1 Tax=Metschnikowia bicuspidata var. bicuspidata NRRL YB-4993 TaxID=869754 RepID=A0A1A0H9V5_9ASCO|nr:hypothetical protein METBIDRAFT_12735 [Metschnikowia bicuspidata var. bicuspidata NRRL YB-4993]OBA20796.1 hypothetical protein METBIDRAFT_12735 [Metschnikowia bicuspidata var. bicuspidata NRRL YB-4993]
MTDTTQELVDKFSNSQMAGSGTPSMYSKMPFDGHKLQDFDPLDDPLDDTSDLKDANTYLANVTLPPTPRDSPLKMDIERLRGSPIKAARRQFRTPRISRPAVENAGQPQETSPVLMSGFDEDFDPLNVFQHDVVRDTKKLGGYQTLLLLSTDRLTQELYSERVRNGELQREIDALRREKNDVNRWKTDFDTLQKQNQSLRSRNLSLELQMNNFQRNDKSDQLARENRLLRDKLLKYKNLYDALLRERQGGPESVSRDTLPCLTLSEPKAPAAPNHRNEPPKQKTDAAHEAFSHPALEDDGDVQCTGRVPPKTIPRREAEQTAVWDDERFLAQLRGVLEALGSRSPLEKHGGDAESTMAHSDEVGHDSPPSQRSIPKHTLETKASSRHSPQVLPGEQASGISPPSAGETNGTEHAAPVHPNIVGDQTSPETIPAKCEEQFSRLEHVLNLIREDFRTQVSRTTDTRMHDCECARPSTPLLTDERAVPASPLVHQKNTCAACLGVASMTRPQSESMPKENDTRALMGKFLWNRTV